VKVQRKCHASKGRHAEGCIEIRCFILVKIVSEDSEKESNSITLRRIS
jgi:hypothetical protein